MLPTAYAEPPCIDNDNNGICDDFCPDFDGDGNCDVSDDLRTLPPAPEASNPEFIPGGNPHGDDPNMPPVPAPVLPDVSEVLPPGNPPPVVQLPENPYVVPLQALPEPPVVNPEESLTSPRPIGSPVPPPPGIQAIPPVSPPAEVPPAEVPPAAQAPTSPPVEAPPPDLLPLPDPPPAQSDYDVPSIYEDPSVPLPSSDQQPDGGEIYWVPDEPTSDNGSTYEPDYTYDEPDYTYDEPDSTYDEPDYTYDEPDSTYDDSDSSYDSDSTYDDSDSSYDDSDSSSTYDEPDVVCDEDGYCS